MDVEKSVQTTEFMLLGKVVFKISKKTEINYKQNVEPIEPVIELNLTETDN